MARDYITRSAGCLKEAEMALKDGDFARAVRRSQEALELGAKAVLRYLAVEYPREHDVGEALEVMESRLSPYLRDRLPEFSKLLERLASERGPAFYGYEREGIPANKIFSREYATETLDKVRDLTALCAKFLQEHH